jgi:hypothetical protein
MKKGPAEYTCQKHAGTLFETGCVECWSSIVLGSKIGFFEYTLRVSSTLASSSLICITTFIQSRGDGRSN